MGLLFTTSLNLSMKKILFSAAIAMVAVTSYAQQDLNTAADAVRYSLDNLTGTARFRAMGGAFGAVGGDPSAINVNPAGSAILMYNTGTATLSSYNINNQANYFGTSRKQNDNTFDLNQIGGFFVFNNAKEDAFMNKFTLGFQQRRRGKRGRAERRFVQDPGSGAAGRLER